MKRLVLAVLLAAFTAGLSAQSASSPWQEFRRQHRYHVQGLALSEPDASGHRTLVVAEPPPSVTLASLSRVDPLLAHPLVMSFPIGTDGWVKDVVFDLAPVEDSRLAGLIDRLSLEMFGTTYKAYALPIAAGAAPAHMPLDLQVSASQLQAWLTSDSERFQPLGGGAASTVRQLLAGARSGIFYSAKPGLVAWVVSKRADVSQLRRETRQFAVDTDLILGAIPGATHVAIIARERQAPVELLPPLRSETIALLASVGDDELSQSYERRAFGAGKLEVSADWAPIYLSDVLIDTEYGSLLNITDQLLKSWTEGGQVLYARFDYPEPASWPFGKPLGDVLTTDRLTYNWNTKGAGYALAASGGQVFALNRTGALPVSYMPEGLPAEQAAQMARYEDTAYTFFATTGDPNLARVVQYAGLYQIFRHYLTDAPHRAVAPVPRPEMAALGTVVQRNLQAFADADDDELMALAEDNGYRLSAQGLADARKARQALREYRTSARDPQFITLARTLTDPRPDQKLLDSASPAADAALVRLLHASELRPLLEPFMAVLFSVDEAFEAFTDAPARETTTWIKTPTHVVSLSPDPDEITGGHNLDARVTVFETDARIPPGTVKVRVNARGERVVTVNPAEAGKVGAAVRTAAREEPAQLQASVERVLRTSVTTAVRPRNEALGLSPTLGVGRAHSDRGLMATHIPGAAYRSGWSVASTPAAPEYQTAIARTTNVFIDRNPDFSYRVTFAGMDDGYVARSHDAAIDIVADTLQARTGRADPATIVFSGIDRVEADNFLRSVEVRAKAKGRATGIGRSSRTSVTELPPRSRGRTTSAPPKSSRARRRWSPVSASGCT